MTGFSQPLANWQEDKQHAYDVTSTACVYIHTASVPSLCIWAPRGNSVTHMLLNFYTNRTTTAIT